MRPPGTRLSPGTLMLSEALLGENSAETSKNFLLLASCFAFPVGMHPQFVFGPEEEKK